MATYYTGLKKTNIPNPSNDLNIKGNELGGSPLFR